MADPVETVKAAVQVAPAIPFMLTAGQNSRISGARIFEAVIIAICAAAMSSYLTIGKLEEKLSGIALNVQDVKQRLDRIEDRQASQGQRIGEIGGQLDGRRK